MNAAAMFALWMLAADPAPAAQPTAAPEPAVASPPPSARIPVDAVAAVVERRVITVSEVAAEAHLLILERAGAEVAQSPVDAHLLGAVLDAMVAQELLALEARRTGVAVREIDIDRSLGTLRARFEDADRARRFFLVIAADEELLRSRARRDLAAQALLSRTFAVLKVSDAEVAAWAHDHPPGADGMSARDSLLKSRKDELLNELLRRLQKDVEVRVVWTPSP